jgi:hypothetical protein
MPWREVSVMDQRREFVRLAMQGGVNRRELCRRFGISPDVGYKCGEGARNLVITGWGYWVPGSPLRGAPE